MPVSYNNFENENNVALKMSYGKNGLVEAMETQSTLLWNKKIKNTNMEKFARKVEEKYNQHFGSYWEFHKWSVENYVDFWNEVWNYFGIIVSRPHDQVLCKTGNGFLDNEWFHGARFNFAENILRIRDRRVALICADELGNEETVTFAHLYEEVKLFAAAFRKNGLRKGDRIACYMSNIKEAIFAMLAATSIGAIWSGPLPYYGARAASNIVKTMEAKFLIAVDHLQDNGEQFYPINNLAAIAKSASSVTHVIIVPTKNETLSRDISDIPNSIFLDDFLQSGMNSDGTVPDLVFEQLPFSHPIAINFTSGTTGLPKGPVHSAGTILPVLRDFAFHLNCKSGDTVLSAYPNGWSLWDYPIPALSLGVKLFLYNGSLYYRKNGYNIWNIFSQYKVSFAFLVTAVVDKLEKEKIRPGPETNLDHLKVIGMGGSPVKKQNFEYLQKTVKKDLFVGSMYGATEVFGAFSGFDLNSPSYGGEIQAPALGVDIRCLDQDGNYVIGQRGELVIATPTPSFPVYLWKDENNKRLKDTYFSKYNGVWCQNDECWINPKTNGIIVIGRSDDTMKQNGERFGSGDIYFAIHNMEELQDYLCVGQDGADGDSRAVLFVKLKKGQRFTPALKKKIEATINDELWCDYVPQVILETPDIPYNLNNKRMESIVRKIVATNEVPEAMNIKNPDCLQYFRDIPEIISYTKK
ncbi:hypothetical protein JTE90_027949 [Oedothorax gibbosus]|uniref:Acetoacetyl-CoA synthetase n=1 Tax=Oedothorax gibbosus TaxID=931172 RepID=A0AAV6VHR8_9ARAC|nr:hypothetical protein JTE90_027949 [Oedothorax gibbosus]